MAAIRIWPKGVACSVDPHGTASLPQRPHHYILRECCYGAGVDSHNNSRQERCCGNGKREAGSGKQESRCMLCFSRRSYNSTREVVERKRSRSHGRTAKTRIADAFDQSSSASSDWSCVSTLFYLASPTACHVGQSFTFCLAVLQEPRAGRRERLRLTARDAWSGLPRALGRGVPEPTCHYHDTGVLVRVLRSLPEGKGDCVCYMQRQHAGVSRS